MQRAALACATLLLATACRRAPETVPSISIQHEIAPSPARVGPSLVTLRLTQSGGAPATGARITLEANMSHPGMSPEFSDARETSPGSYQAKLAFNMAGDWIILAHIALRDGQKLERQMEVHGVRPN